MNWDDMKIVDAAARTLSLSRASKLLGMSQPQLSRRLRQFEDQVGARLFDRTPSGLKPTEAGARLIPLAADMRLQADAAARALPDLAATSMRVVRVSVDEVRADILASGLARHDAQLKGIELELIDAQLHADHQNRGTELQIRTCLPDTDTLVARRIGTLAYAVYGSREFVDRNPAARTADRYALCDWIGFAPDKLWYPAQKLWLDQRSAKRPCMRTNTMTTARDLTATGAGLGILPVFMGDRHPDLIALTDPIEELSAPEHLILHRDLLREPAVRIASNAIAEIYRETSNHLNGGGEVRATG
ncbi:LysR family transcriptional regulator [Roseibium sp. RKSG952]|uniref:LysR family transcriptional regulator n=1 Tax=Roseibium sp. RKSG952 TaxID=2529384 RepID=UPI0012BD6B02|nr:LysR family transcriptional regulator [Roseibium sp. RKSG952]MTH97244.1 LysR family transcriptional regulator [Roseibium sp. RKSG952]